MSPCPRKKKLSFFMYLYLFFATSMLGWLWEVLLFLFKDGSFANRGFLHGPWLPVYGSGAVAMLLLLHHHRKNPFFVFFLSMTVGSLVELLLGWFLDTFYDVRYWDYSGYFCNLNGYICLLSAFLFGLAGFFFVCIFAQKLADLWNFVPGVCQRWILLLLTICFVFDFIFSFFFPNEGSNVTFPAFYRCFICSMVG